MGELRTTTYIKGVKQKKQHTVKGCWDLNIRLHELAELKLVNIITKWINWHLTKIAEKEQRDWGGWREEMEKQRLKKIRKTQVKANMKENPDTHITEQAGSQQMK